MTFIRPSEILFANDNFVQTEEGTYEYDEVSWVILNKNDQEALDKWGLM